jgi:hypothetical protein
VVVAPQTGHGLGVAAEHVGDRRHCAAAACSGGWRGSRTLKFEREKIMVRRFMPN